MASTRELRDGLIRIWGTSASIDAASLELPPGAYTTLRTYGGDRVVRLGQHVRRLVDSVRLQGQEASLDEPEVRRLLAEALRAVPHLESRLRLTFAPPSLFVSVEPLEPVPEPLYREGAWCVSVPLRRENPGAKDTRFIAAASAAYRSLPAGAHEGLMVGEDGAILEGLSSNFFALEGGALRTEERRALSGITRSLVLELCQGFMPVSMAPVRLADLPRVAECFLTSVSREILPVTRVDDVVIGPGEPGPVTRELMRRFRALMEREAVSLR